MTHVIVAMDNVTLRGEDVDPNMILMIATIQNDWLEQNRQQLTDAMVELCVFGTCSIMVH